MNEVREQYQVLPFKKPEHQVARDEYGRSSMESVGLKVRKAYYDMENNPQEKLCDKLWEIIIQAVLTEIP